MYFQRRDYEAILPNGLFQENHNASREGHWDILENTPWVVLLKPAVQPSLSNINIPYLTFQIDIQLCTSIDITMVKPDFQAPNK